MSYKIILAVAGILILAVSVIRMFLRAGHSEDGDHVAQSVLTRINNDYRNNNS